MLNYLPKYFSSKAIYLYLGALIVSNVIFFSNMLSLVWIMFGITEVVGFFYFSNNLTRKWANYSPKFFRKKLFLTAFIIRLGWVVVSFLFYTNMTGQPFEFHAADSKAYHDLAISLVDLINTGNIQSFFDNVKGGYSDMGYPLYLGWQYWLSGSSIIFARIIKALLGAYTCLLLYRLATRSFGEEIGRMASIFCMLMPNMIYYSGLHVKEVEMVFLTVLFVERSDFMIRNKVFDFWNIAPLLALALSLFFFRTVLGATALFSIAVALLLSTERVLNMGKRVVLIILLLIGAVFFVGSKMSIDIEAVWAAKNTNQETSFNWRSTRENGNKFSKYASSSVFIPMILVIPFPTLVEIPNQENMKLIHGGNFVKNILAFFVLFAFYWVLKNSKWRDYMLIGSFTVGYLVVIAMSSFAQSERFHQPAMPFLLIMAAFGLSQVTNKQKIYFKWYMVLLFVAILGWSWFKLAGRDML